MKDPEIKDLVDLLQGHITSINEIISNLHTKNVEIRISYNDAKAEKSAYITLWKATEHNDYVEDKR